MCSIHMQNIHVGVTLSSICNQPTFCVHVCVYVCAWVGVVYVYVYI